MSVHELASLPGLRRLHLVRVPKLTDIAVYSLADYGIKLEQLSLSYCDQISLDAVRLLLSKLRDLRYLAAIGIPSLKREGIQQFSEIPPQVSFFSSKFCATPLG
jgi:F-box and leucine-rich repeat protein GRR1